mgnify:CR=1 FL=1
MSPVAEALQGIDAANVSRWLAANVAGAVPPFRFELIAGGRSNLTFRVTGADGTRYVLRRPPVGLVLATALKLLPTLRSSALGVPAGLGFAAVAALSVTAWHWPLWWVVTGIGSLAVALAWWRLRPS